MTEPKIILPSMIWDEVDAKIANQEAEIADKDAKLANKDAKIQRLQELISQLSPCNPIP